MTPHSEKKFATLRKWNRSKNYFMKSLRMRFAKMIWDHRSKKTFALQDIQTILLLRDDDKIGDMVVSTSVMRELSKQGYTVDILATPKNIEIVKNNPYINKVLSTEASDITAQLSAEKYDLVIDMGDKISPRSLRFLRSISAKNVIGFNKENYNIYNKSIQYNDYNSHITNRYDLLMQVMGLSDYSTQYELFYPSELDQDVLNFLKNTGHDKFILVNAFAADSRREMSFSQLEELILSLKNAYPATCIILLDHLNRIDLTLPDDVYISPFNTLLSAIALIAHIDMIISPDTSIVHIAATYQKPLVALYGNDLHGQYVNSDVWGPGYANAIQLRTVNKYHPVSSIPVNEIVAAVHKLSAGELK
ncbi:MULTISPECIES: glycosyltransferase family 9 protein [Enterobacterales]|uniref:glycosyltransferase family 9 protein n=1 Tax=Enterobacterales TaxID=91347 RepID=UPI002ED9B341